MKFGYAYKTSDGTRLESVYTADAKEDVFAGLRARGIRPIKVWEIKPSRAHRVVLWCGIALAAFVVAGVSVFAVLKFVDSDHLAETENLAESDTLSRRQIYGDPGILQACESHAWANVFSDPGECFLARFARPGLSVRLPAFGIGSSARAEVVKALQENRRLLRIREADSDVVAQMKRMVNWMKQELAQYLADGGSVEEYIEEVLERQRVEEKIVASFKDEFDRLTRNASSANMAETIEKWNAKNATLREMGLRTVLMPESWAEE